MILESTRTLDHFDIYDGPEHDSVVGDELAFVRRHLREAKRPGEASRHDE